MVYEEIYLFLIGLEVRKSNIKVQADDGLHPLRSDSHFDLE